MLKKYFLLLTLFISICSALFAQDSIYWHEPVVLASELGIPEVAVQGDTIHVTWMAVGNVKLPYKRSVTEGLDWDTLRYLWPTEDTLHIPSYRWVIADKSSLYMVWQDYDLITHKSNPAWRASYDQGTTWLPVKRIIVMPGDNLLGNGTILNDTICYSLFPGPEVNPKILRIYGNGKDWNLSPNSVGTSLLGMNLAITEGVLHMTMGESETYYQRSYNLGNTWQNNIALSTLDENSSDYESIVANNNNLYISWRESKYGCGSGLGCSIVLRKSDTGGDEWLDEQIISDSPNGFEPHPYIYDNIIAVAWTNDAPTESKIRYSLNGGNTWCPVVNFGYGTGTKVVVTTHAIHVFYTNEGTHQVIYRRGEIVTGVKENETNQPHETQLYQNYPDPFNPITDIGYWLIGESNVTLKVYNITGQEVTTLVNKQQKAGKHDALWRAEDYPSGWYVYRLTVTDGNNKTITLAKKMILLK